VQTKVTTENYVFLNEFNLLESQTSVQFWNYLNFTRKKILKIHIVMQNTYIGHITVHDVILCYNYQK